MIEIIQQTFLGASVSRFTASLGWGRSQSSLTVNLVEDPVNNDRFTPDSNSGPQVGHPVYFNYSGWEFGGLLQSWVERRGQSGFEYIVTVTDPRDLLEGVQLILSGYTGGVYGVPNIYNVYGYLEASRGFGGAETNESGIPWYLVRDAFDQLLIQVPINFRDHLFFLDLLNLPVVSEYFRIAGDTISALDYIEQVCDAASCDYFITLREFQGMHYITLHTVSRAIAPTLGKIHNFIDNIQANTTEAGVELRNEPTSKFLIGGPVQAIQYVEHDFDTATLQVSQYTAVNGDRGGRTPEGMPYRSLYELTDIVGSDIRTLSIYNNIIPYWGTYISTGEPIIGEFNPEMEYLYSGNGINGYYIPHRFTIDIFPALLETVADRYRTRFYDNGVDLGCPYTTDVMEMRAVLAGQDAWETFLYLYNDKEYLDQDGTNIHSGLGLYNPHYMKARLLNIITTLDLERLKAVFEAGAGPALMPIDMFLPMARTYTLGTDEEDMEDPREKDLRKLYEYLSTYANEYFGRKYLVKISDIYVKQMYEGASSETDVLFTSLEVADGGYLEEGLWANAISTGKLPFDVNKFTSDDGKITAFVRYDNYYREYLNPSNGEYKIGKFHNIRGLNQDDFTMWNNSLYVKCTVEPKIVFLGPNYTEPRVVISLNSPVGKNDQYSLQMGIYQYVGKDVLDMSDKQLIELYNKCSSSVLSNLIPQIFLTPDAAAIPLKSNVETYGPWYSIGANGKTDVEQDTTLTPWNYGSFYNMNLAANAKLMASASFFQAGETGTITFAGLPEVQLGRELVSSGPYVTDINVEIGSNGVTTTYRMNTWAFQFGKPEKLMEERFRKLTLDNRQRRREARDLYKKITGTKSDTLKYGGFSNTNNMAKRVSPRTISPLIMGEASKFNNVTTGQSEASSDVFMAHPNDIVKSIQVNYDQKAGGSLDILFRPFSTASGVSVDGFNGAHFVVPSSTNVATSTSLNPFTQSTDFSAIVNSLPMISGGIPEHGISNYGITSSGIFRGIGLRGPVVIVGWGYDITGKPVPNATPTNPGSSFIANHKQRADLWKAGPLDIRWDEGRGVWTASGSSVAVGKLEQSLNTNLTGSVRMASQSSTGSVIYDSTIIQCLNITGVTLPSGSLVIKYTVDGFKFPVIAPFEWGNC